MNKVLYFLITFLNVDTICSFIARFISKTLSYASQKGGDTWEKSKRIISKIHLWCGLFLEVYEDDNMTPEEEQKIAEAIKNQTNIGKVVDILNNETKE